MIKRMGFGMLGAVVLLAGCGGEDEATPTPTASVPVVEPMLTGGDVTAPKDSVPGPGAASIYFVAEGPSGPGVFKVSGEGGAPSSLASSFNSAVEAGAPEVPEDFVLPTGIAWGTDGDHVYVADPMAINGVGAIVAVQISTQTGAVVNGTVGFKPTALDVTAGETGDVITFTGTTINNPQPALLRVAAAGGVPTPLFRGAPLVTPYGVAVASDGRVYVSDKAAGTDGAGAVFKLNGSALDPVVSEVVTGEPAGIALTMAEDTLLVSAINADTGRDYVLIVNLTDLSTTTFTEVIEANSDGGGVHRAPDADIFAWADLSAGGTGQVYKISLH